ncbi:MAG TPA: SGNH/GDSL hydrolase family protein [Phycisphaerae bacterium]|nr:SGNH/GDSL hydrolase family protein [Phycisphaerae bacterium]HRW55381.1 SGNH/GDSL hydrolase family protein [Phycisphaerae bacterium]
MYGGRFRRLIRLTILCGLMTVTGACDPGAPVATRPYSALVIFGDSLSDNGNLTGELNLVPPPPYAPGRYSNGDIWVDHLARHFDLRAEPAYLGGTNFAHGAAGTDRGAADIRGVPVGFNLREQVNWYLDLYTPRGDELFVIWSGGNDLFDMLAGVDGLTPQSSADNIAIAINVLYDAGARRFFVMTAPDLSVTPRYRNSSRKGVAREMTMSFNNALLTHLDLLDGLRDIHIARLDVAPLLRDLVDNPPAGISNTTDPAWSGDLFGYLGEGEVVPDPDSYLYWDRQHPTRMGHAFIAQYAIEAITASLEQTPTTPVEARPEQSHFAASSLFWYRYLGL